MESDKRFSKILKDPRFKRIPRRERKVIIDSRFRSMFSDSKFKAKYSVDKRGRPIKKSSKEDLEKFYDFHEDKEDQPTPETEDKRFILRSSGKENDIKDGSISLEEDDAALQKTVLEEESSDSSDDDDIDYSDIRGGALSSSSDEEDLDNDDDEGLEHEWGELDKDAKRKEDAVTSRLAACNLDWDRVTANDLYVLCSSFGGLIKSVKVYLSEFGKQRLAEEDLSGPKELKDVEESEMESGDLNNLEGASFHMEKLREYQLNRLKYYYAVVDCDSKETASKIYDECDGMEYELSATRLDLRFIPEDMEFDGEPRQIATELPLLTNYQPTRANQVGFEQVFDNLTFKHMDALRKQIQSLVDFVLNHGFWTGGMLNKFLQRLQGLSYFRSPIWFALISTRGMTMGFKFRPRTFYSEAQHLLTSGRFHNTALQQSTVRLTWDEPDQNRLQMTMRKFDKDEIMDMDFKAYIASSSEEEEGNETTQINAESAGKIENAEKEDMDNEDARVEKYKALLNEIEAKDSKDDKDHHMEISWEPALSEKTDEIIKNKMENEEEKQMTPWEKYQRQKVKRGKRKDQIKDRESDTNPNDHDQGKIEHEIDEYIPTGADDPFFAHDDNETKTKEYNNKKKKKRLKVKEGLTEEEKEHQAREKNELELLLMDDKEDRQHFNMKHILDNEKRKKKKKRNKKEITDQTVDDNFEIDVQDTRFNALFNSADYSLDPSDPQFKKSKAMDKIILEKQRRRKEGHKTTDTGQEERVASLSKKQLNPSLSALVKNVKARTEQFKNKKKSIKKN